MVLRALPLPPLPWRVLLIPTGINVHDEHGRFLAIAQHAHVAMIKATMPGSCARGGSARRCGSDGDIKDGTIDGRRIAGGPRLGYGNGTCSTRKGNL